MKKKLITMLTGAAMAASLFAAPQVLAADAQQDRLQQKDQTCEYFVDENKDGVCDNINEERQLQKQDGTGNPEGEAFGRQYRKGAGAGSLHFNDRESVKMTRQGACWVPGNMQSFGAGKAENNGEQVQTRAKNLSAEEKAPVEAKSQEKKTGQAASRTGDQARVQARIHVEPATADQDQKRDRVQLKDQSDPDCDGTGVPVLKQDGTGGKGARKGK